MYIMLIHILALVDAATGVWLIRYALSRERRDKDAVLVVGIVLLGCAAALVAVELLLADEPGGGGGPAPTNI